MSTQAIDDGGPVFADGYRMVTSRNALKRWKEAAP
jgi:hypothetical protein